MAGIDRKVLFERYTQARKADLDRLSSLVIRAQGSRTMQEFAGERGLNISTLSRIQYDKRRRVVDGESQ